MAVSNKERSRRWRERQREGAVVVGPMAVPPIVIQALVVEGALTEADALDAAKLLDALAGDLERRARETLAKLRS